jgi:hypothetical protein
LDQNLPFGSKFLALVVTGRGRASQQLDASVELLRYLWFERRHGECCSWRLWIAVSSIDTLLPIEGTGSDYIGKMHLPAYAIGTVLGHRHVIRQAIQCGAKFGTPSGVSFEPHITIQEIDKLPTDLLLWVIKRTQPEALKYSVRECGFQFC